MPSLPSGPVRTVLSDLQDFHISPIKRSLFLKGWGTEDGNSVGHRDRRKNSKFHTAAADKVPDLTDSLLASAYLSICGLLALLSLYKAFNAVFWRGQNQSSAMINIPVES